MSALAAVRAAALARLRGEAALTVNRVLDGADGRGTMPYAVLRDVIASDWGTKDRDGREVRVGITIRDEGESPTRVTRLASVAEGALLDLPRGLTGWRVASVVPVRSAVLAEGQGRWAALIDVRVRVLAE
ncbi:tail completion protein gp17 [Sphingomonas sp. MMS24-JH45]